MANVITSMRIIHSRGMGNEKTNCLRGGTQVLLPFAGPLRPKLGSTFQEVWRVYLEARPRTLKAG